MLTPSPLLLGEADWHARRGAHVARVDAWLIGHRGRRRVGAEHPVEDFLFTYYSQRPSHLRRWHPGHGVTLAGESAGHFLELRDYISADGGVRVDTSAVLQRRGEGLTHVRRLLEATAGRPAFFGCFGMHEWAMLYRPTSEELRHASYPLRLSNDEVAAVVEERGVRCGHHDAFRFFTPTARPLNVLQPTRADQVALEQPGCLHANMDLYKWAYKLTPLAPSELVADCFGLAREIRELDMRASPYDLTALGYEPVRIETAEGRAEYAAAQRDFAARAEPLRQRLIAVLDAAMSSSPTSSAQPAVASSG